MSELDLDAIKQRSGQRSDDHWDCHQDILALIAEVEQLTRELDKVRELHEVLGGFCVECSKGFDGVPHPCPTIEAIS